MTTICRRSVGTVFHNEIIDKENDENVKKWTLMALKEAIQFRNSCMIFHEIIKYTFIIRWNICIVNNIWKISYILMLSWLLV